MKPLSQTASAQWKRRNREHVKRKLKEWLVANSERRKIYTDARNSRLKHFQKNYDAARYLKPENVAKRNDPEEKARKKTYMAKWLSEHPEQGQLNHSKRKARKRGNGIGDQKLIAAWFKKWRALSKIACYWCRLIFHPDECHGDHITPLAKGGAHTIENMCVACEGCNMRKHDKPLLVWNQQISEPVLF